MSDPLTKYYKSYYEREGDKAYLMEEQRYASRVLTIQDWIKANAKPGDKILDVGCGDMYLSKAMPEYSWQGIDVNISRAKGPAIEQDLMSTPYPFEAASFDLVVNSETMEHIWDMRVVHREVNRLLKQGGLYILTTPNFSWLDHYMQHFNHLLWDPDNRPHTSEHIRQYNFVVHEKWLKATGFTITDFTGADAHYSVFLQEARGYLKQHLLETLGHKEYENDGRVDQILGRCFRVFSHTICLLARKN